jgi:glycosyltransferase involved in cell wall biosynthesis
MRPEAGSVAVSLSGLLGALRAHDVESEIVASDGGSNGALDQAASTEAVKSADVVHLHGWGYPIARAAARAARRAKKPYVISPHGMIGDDKRKSKRLRQRLRVLLTDNPLIRKAAAVTALNESEERALRARRIRPRIVRLPYGIDFSEYESADTSASETSPVSNAALVEARGSTEGRYVLMLGPIHPVEGLVPLLKAFAELGPEAESWNVAIAGSEVGDWRKMLQAAVRRKKAEGRVIFAPAPDLTAQRAWLTDASILAPQACRLAARCQSCRP